MSKIILDFLGKDSINYHGELDIPSWIAEEFEKLMKNKNSNDKLFDKTNSIKTIEFMNNIIPGFYIKNKLFRTAIATSIVNKAIQENEWSSDMTDKEFQRQYNKCALEATKQLNHKKTVDEKKLKEQLVTFALKIKDQKIKVETLKEKWHNETNKDKKSKIKKQLDIAETKLNELKLSKEDKKNHSGEAINTAKSNYTSPKSAFSLCKYCNKEPKLLFTKSLLSKFEWAKDVDSEYWKTAPTIK